MDIDKIKKKLQDSINQKISVTGFITDQADIILIKTNWFGELLHRETLIFENHIKYYSNIENYKILYFDRMKRLEVEDDPHEKEYSILRFSYLDKHDLCLKGKKPIIKIIESKIKNEYEDAQAFRTEVIKDIFAVKMKKKIGSVKVNEIMKTHLNNKKSINTHLETIEENKDESLRTDNNSNSSIKKTTSNEAKRNKIDKEFSLEITNSNQDFTNMINEDNQEEKSTYEDSNNQDLNNRGDKQKSKEKYNTAATEIKKKSINIEIVEDDQKSDHDQYNEDSYYGSARSDYFSKENYNHYYEQENSNHNNSRAPKLSNPSRKNSFLCRMLDGMGITSCCNSLQNNIVSEIEVNDY